MGVLTDPTLRGGAYRLDIISATLPESTICEDETSPLLRYQQINNNLYCPSLTHLMTH